MQYTYIFLIIYAIVLLYWGWYTFLSIVDKLISLGRIINKGARYFFDTFFKGFIWSVLLGRLVWIISHFYDVLKVGFFYLPYIRDGWHFEFLTYYPWRFLRITEGFNVIISIIGFWVYISIFIVLFMFPEIQHLRIKNEVIKHNLFFKLISWWLGFSIYCVIVYNLVK